jgi:hypothetical protein
MPVTLKIDRASAEELKRATGRTAAPVAVLAAVTEILRLWRIRRLVAMVKAGRVEYGRTNEELENMAQREPSRP